MKRLFALCLCLCKSPNVFVFLCVHASPPFYHSSRSGSIPKGLILQGNLSFSQQRQTWRWGKSTLPWWSWSTTGRARSSARRLSVMSRYCCLKERKKKALGSTCIRPFWSQRQTDALKSRLRGCKLPSYKTGLWQPWFRSRVLIQSSKRGMQGGEHRNLALYRNLPWVLLFPTVKSAATWWAKSGSLLPLQYL